MGGGTGAEAEEGIKTRTLADLDTGGGVDVTSKEREEVVLEGGKQAKVRGHHLLTSSRRRSLTTPPWRALTMSERSGGRAPAFPARAASSLG